MLSTCRPATNYQLPWRTYEENRNHFWDGEQLSAGGGGANQWHEGRRRDGGVREGWRSEDGDSERLSRDHRPHLPRHSLLSRIPEECRANRDIRHQQSVLVDSRQQIFQPRAGDETRCGDPADRNFAAPAASARHDRPIHAEPYLSAELGGSVSLHRVPCLP